MRALAQNGMLVAARDHADEGTSCPNGRPDPKDLPLDYLMNRDNWQPAFYQDRRKDIQELWAALQADPAYAGLIDSSRVALVGHSLGGYTVLGLAGAWKTWKTEDIAAVVALAPFAQPFGSGAKPLGIVPVLFQAGSMDLLTPESVVRAAYDATPKPACMVVYEGADHFAWAGPHNAYQDAVGAATVAFLNQVFAGQAPTAAVLASPHIAGRPECK